MDGAFFNETEGRGPLDEAIKFLELPLTLPGNNSYNSSTCSPSQRRGGNKHSKPGRPTVPRPDAERSHSMPEQKSREK